MIAIRGRAVACGRGHTVVVDVLLAHGLDVNEPTSQGNSPLLTASKHGRDSVARQLLHHGADPNQLYNGVSPLFVACSGGHGAVVGALLDGGARVNQAAHDGSTALFVACENGHEDVVSALLKGGAAVGQATNKGAVPLFISCQSGHAGVVKLLLAHGGVDLQQTMAGTGATALFIAAQQVPSSPRAPYRATSTRKVSCSA